MRKKIYSMLVLLCLTVSGAWAGYYAWSGGGSSPFYFDDTANWGFKTYGGGMWIAVPAIGSRSDNINIDPTLLVNDGKGNGTTATFEGKTVSGVAYDVDWNGSFPASWNKTITFRNTTSLIAPIYLNYSGETVSFVATDASYGLTSSNQLWVRSGSTLQIESGTYSFENDIVVAGTLSVSGAMLKNTARYLHIGDGGNGTVTIGPGGVYENFGNLGSLTVAHASGNSGTLNVAGGTVSISGGLTMCYNASSVSAAVNVTDGGVLTVKSLVLGNAGTSGGVVTLDGGTLRAYADESPFVVAHESLRVYAGANGATFDSNGKTITIAESIEDKSGEAGVVRFTGGGTIMLSGVPSYTGRTTNVAGTVLSLTAEAKTALVAHPIAVEIPPAGVADGTTVLEINDGNGTFSQAEVDAIAVTGPDASRYALVLADGGTKVVISATPAYDVTANLADGAYWATFYRNDGNYQAPEGTQVFAVNLDPSTAEITMTEIPNRIALSGKGVVLKKTTTGSITMTKTETAPDVDYSGSSLTGTMTSITNPGNAYVLNGKNGAGFYKLSDGGTIDANKAYLTYSGGAGAREFFLFDEATGIEMPTAEDNADADAVVYDLQGRRVVNPTKGLYIVNGKKVFINK